MNLNQLDIIVSEVPQVCADLERILDKKADYVDDSFAQFTIGSHCLMLSEKHLISLENFQSGIILHIEVEDVEQNYQRLKDLGITVLNGPAVTDWGTESLLVKGPASLVLDFYRMK
ncbi:Glyoxalase-like domain protein [Streptococcus oralis]|uniref:Glyoxalase-like domain protein n=1 Tax=Streptococcus oralis TaxID=1303 RepID=A0A3R9LG93_STROR|nr:VOC family protein [Streptococcus oralis]RSK19089.1 Glyoxalase-like domain protein [Streptococcus oralis]